ncbi:MFS transporter [Actinomadura sp. ATCC 31491]|uniref:MFS transporter n=1 Tax=Actinomadura luzonensis TaxID=2805427 RepID=A0ABT0FUW9_9ACTN|nr:MFS transporter [Actinomadura luzonensis]MCK2215958.1 MFS transporter [Actinomadura luzonensis]
MVASIVRRGELSRAAPFLCFAGFGVFWGVWGATLPLLRERAGVDDAGFGVALLLVGAGALPAMLLTGRLVDALGLRTAGTLLATLGVLGVVLSVVPAGYAGLCAGILLVGAGSGACDVAINTLAATVERRTGRPVVARSHAAFSGAVALSSLGAGALAGLAGSLVVNFAAAGAVVVALGAAAVARTGAATTAGDDHPAPGTTPGDVHPAPGTTAGDDHPAPASTVGDDHSAPAPARGAAVLWGGLVVVGAVGALAFAAENAYQSWAAVLLTDTFAAGPAAAAAAPAAFAATAALSRLAAGAFMLRRPLAALAGGALVATAGGVLTALAPVPALAVAGVVVAACGTAALFPTLLSYGLRDVRGAARGRATSAVTTVAYLGFLAGPACFGLLADAAGVQRAFLGVAAVTGALLVTIPALSAAGRRLRAGGAAGS